MPIFKRIINIFNKEAVPVIGNRGEASSKTKRLEESSTHNLRGLPEVAAAELYRAGSGALKGATFLNPEQLVPEKATSAGQESWQEKPVRIWQQGENILHTYRVEDIKAGGMGCVYIAEHQGWKTRAAIKSPNQKMLSNPLLFARVLREADAWIGLGLHPHIAYCYYTRPVEDIPYIFIEYVDGGNLRDWIRAGRCYDLKVGLDLAVQFCHGMEHAHNSGMIHRDIKPENILLTRDGILKVTDFGIARSAEIRDKAAAGNKKQAEKKERLTSLGAMGTFEYMSPQQYEDPRSVDARDDIFSFGICLYEMLCGNYPFKAQYPYVARINREEPVGPRQFRTDLPEPLAHLLYKCCSLKRDARPAGFKDIRSQLVNIYRSIYHEEPPHAELVRPALKADGLNNRGVSYYYLGREDEARKCWEQALQEDPLHLGATFNLGYSKWPRAEMSGCDFLNQMRAIESNQKSNPDYWLCMGWLYLEQWNIASIEEIQRSPYYINNEDFLLALNNPNRPEGRLVRNEYSGRVLSVSLSSDGRYALSGGYDKIIHLWEVAGGKELRVFKGHAHYIRSVAFSPDGCYALSGSNDKSMRLWEVASGKELYVFKGHTAQIHSVAFSPDGRYALSGSDDETIRLWEVASGKELHVFKGHTARIYLVAFSPDGRYILSITDSRNICLWDVDSGKKLWMFEGHTKYVSSVAFSPDGRYILSGSHDETIRLWEVASGKELHVFEGHTAHISSVTFSPDGRYVLSGSWDKTIRLWDLDSGMELRVFYGHTGVISSVAFNPDGRYVFSGSSDLSGRDNTLRLWEVASGKEIRVFEEHKEPIRLLVLSPDGSYVLSLNDTGSFNLWEVSYDKKLVLKNHPYPLVSKVKEFRGLIRDKEQFGYFMDISEKLIKKGGYREAYRELLQAQALPGYALDRNLLQQKAKCGFLGEGNLSRLNASWLERVFEGHTGAVNSVAFSPDGRYILSGSWDKTMRLWEGASGKELHVFNGHTAQIQSVAFSPDGRYAISGSDDKTIRLWDVHRGNKIGVFKGHWHDISVHSVTFSPNGKYALSGSWDDWDHSLSLWNVSNRKELHEFNGHTARISSVVFSPDGQYILSGSWDKTIRLWEVASGRELHVFNGHSAEISSVAFSPDGRYILSGSWDKTMRLWDVASGRAVWVSGVHAGFLKSVAFTRTGCYALSGCSDKTVRLWDLTNTMKILQIFEGHNYEVNSVAFSPDCRYVLSGSNDHTMRLWQLDWDWEFE